MRIEHAPMRRDAAKCRDHGPIAGTGQAPADIDLRQAATVVQRKFTGPGPDALLGGAGTTGVG